MAKRGRKPIAPSTPDDLMEAFFDYMDELQKKTRIDKNTGAVIHTPPSWPGFMDHLGLGYKAERFKEYYRAKGEFWGVTITRIENAIERDQLEGAMLGDYHQNIVSRINGYTEKTENKHDVHGGFLWKEIE